MFAGGREARYGQVAMQTPPCPACGTPLRWFPEMNAWGCDRCQQMLPAAGPPVQQGRWSHTPKTQAEKTRTMILGGVLVVAVIGVVIMLATDDKKSDDSGESSSPDVEASAESDTQPAAPAPTPAPAPAPVPAAGAVTTPKGAPINIPECGELVALRKKVEACAAITDKTALFEMVDNKMGVFDTAPPSGEYAEMVRGKCAGTADALKQSLSQASCQ
jgi:hypothetical protein